MARRPRDRETPIEAPWYVEGLHFRCTVCGACCTGAPGYVWVEPGEVEALAKARGMKRREFQRRYVRRIRGRMSLKERENGDCVMLDGDRCSVYDAKPLRCSTFPFWPETLETPEEWSGTAGRCEGIGQGDLYGRAEIEAVAAGDAGPLLRRQREAARRDGTPEPVADAPPSDAAHAAALCELEALYAGLDEELPRYHFTCAASGRCCDFDAYGHRLYVTGLEYEHFRRNAPAGPQNDDPRLCPAWGKDRLCKAREGRMLGCRTYFCGPYPVMPPDDVYERYLRRIKQIHEKHGIPYAYRDVVAWAAER